MIDDMASRLLASGCENVIQSIFDNFLKSNYDYRAKAGMKTTITRKQIGFCCDWCAKVTGTFDYSNAPDDIYKRHRYCNCIVTVKSEKGIQDVWNKKIFRNERDARIEREKEIEEEKKQRKKSSLQKYLEIIQNLDNK